MKTNKKSQLIPIALVFLTLMSIYYLFDSRITLAKEYASILAAARTDADNGVMIKAVEEYSEAISLKPSVELSVEVANKYLQNDDYYSAKRWYEQIILEQYPNDIKTYEFGIKMYIDENKYDEAFEVYTMSQKRKVQSGTINDLMRSIQYKYEIMGSFVETKPFTSSGRAAVSDGEEKWCFVDTTGVDVSETFDYAGSYINGYAAVVKNGEAYFIDKDGNKTLTSVYFTKANNNLKSIQKFADIQSDLILGYDGSSWKYFDFNSYQYLFGDYKEATPITAGIGAVSKNGVDWALIDTNGNEITEFEFNSVVADERGYVCRNNSVIVEKHGYYTLVDKTGAELTSSKYTAAYGFNDETYAAVEKNSKWIFIDSEGNEYNLGDFEEARSFSNGLAAVKVNNRWGYIDIEGNIVVDCIFNEAKMISHGVGFVKDDNQKWRILKFYSAGE